ncbi:MAG: hypothetical protein M1823_004366 [Watsoniomyces obsoletus]|nr:MAG: hypothetical protein M1823_004366 [Watsoniomyces obsoletus]
MAVTSARPTKKKQKESYFQRPKTRRRLEMIAKREEKQLLRKIERKKRKASDVLEVDLSAPEPPSKKALRRAKRSGGVSVPAVAVSTSKAEEEEHSHDEGDDSTTRPSNAGESSKKSENAAALPPHSDKASKRSDYGIWIGNLVYTVTKADIRRFLKDKGTINEDEMTRIHLPQVGAPSRTPKGASKNRGFAYVDFTTSSAFERALGLTEHLMSGRKVLIKDAKSFEGRPSSSQKDPSSNGAATKTLERAKNKRVFIGNLSFDTTEDDLMEQLGKCGEVTKVHVATFEDTGKCKGYAWAEFETLEAAEAAVRGWIPTTEVDESSENEEEEEESTREENQSDDADVDGDDKTRKNTKKKTKKSKKHWINRVKGRTLRMEFAEDKATRYQKRYGKGGTKRPADVANGDGDAGDAPGVSARGGRAEAAVAAAIRSSANKAPPQQQGTGKKIRFD